MIDFILKNQPFDCLKIGTLKKYAKVHKKKTSPILAFCDSGSLVMSLAGASIALPNSTHTFASKTRTEDFALPRLID
jgi:hypothetical protein